MEVPYTGTQNQPDTVSFFFKNAQNQVSLSYENLHARSDYNPLNFQSAIFRIKVAVNEIFRKMKREDIDLWNATKNLTRGIVALVPLIGNTTLYLYDRIKTTFYINSKIKQSLASQNGLLLGIAFDGKIMTTFSTADFSKMWIAVVIHDPLLALHTIWKANIQRNFYLSSNITQNEMLNKLSNQIKFSKHPAFKPTIDLLFPL